MIRKFQILAACLALAGCTDCRKETGAASLTLGEVVYQANMAYDANYINVETLEKIDEATDQAKSALDTARLMCVAEDRSFPAQMSRVKAGIANSLNILDEGKKP